MSYRITYVSPQGHIREIAQALSSILPPETPVEPLTPDIPVDAQVHLVGAELDFRSLEKLPRELENFFIQLSGKQVLLFATLPFYIDDVQRKRAHDRLSKALPQDCDYCGLFLCMAQPEKRLLEGFRHAALQKPDSTRIKHWLTRCTLALGHPNVTDMDQAKAFAAHVLAL